MKSSARILFASMTALTLFAACSGGNASTSSPPESTAPLTVPASTSVTLTTTAPEPSGQSAETSPASSSEQSGLSVEAALARARQQLETLDSYRLTTVTTATSDGNTIKGITILDLFPKSDRMKMTTESSGFKTEAYTVDDKMYMKTPDGTWTVSPMLSPDMNSTDPIPDLQYMEFPEIYILEQHSEGYLIRTKEPLTLEDMLKLDSSSEDPGSSMIPEGMEDLDMDVDLSYEMEMIFSDDFQIKTNTMNTIMKTNESVLERNIQMTYSDFNSVAPFELPQEALNATKISQPAP